MNDQSLKCAYFIWSDILKNPSQSTSNFHVDLQFPHPLPTTGCVGFVFGGGTDGPTPEEVTMSADLDLSYEPASADTNAVVDLSGEYCFGQNCGCQNATNDDEKGFAAPISMPAGRLVELFGDISDSTFDGTRNFGPLPTGKSWGAVNDFTCFPEAAENLERTSTIKGSRNRCRSRRSTAGFPTMRCTWRACP